MYLKTMNAIINTKKIDEYCKQNELNKGAFCKKCGISREVLNRVYDKENVSLKTMYRIADTLGIHILELLTEN